MLMCYALSVLLLVKGLDILKSVVNWSYINKLNLIKLIILLSIK